MLRLQYFCIFTRIDILLRSTSAKPHFVHLGQKNHFCLKWSKRVQMGPKGSIMVKNTYVDHLGPFRTLLDHFGVLTSLPCLALFGPKWTIFGPSPVMNGRPQSKKKGSSPRLLCVGCLWNPKSCHKYGHNPYKMSKIGQNSMKKWPFFAIILQRMASYGSKTSFLLIFSARDDLVKVS